MASQEIKDYMSQLARDRWARMTPEEKSAAGRHRVEQRWKAARKRKGTPRRRLDVQLSGAIKEDAK